MTREQLLEICRRAPNVGAVKHEEFADYVVPLNQRKKVDDEWVTIQVPYMAVDGKLAMANEDHRRQGKRLDFGAPQVLVDNAEQLTLLVTLTSEIYGTRHGIATSRRVGGAEAEREFPGKSRRPPRSGERSARWAMVFSLARDSPRRKICCE